MRARTDIVSKVAEEIRQLIVSGELSGGERINETHLSTRLDVSRTPVREALRRLVGEGAVTSIPNLGFFVAEMSAVELDEVYALRPQLDVVALRMGGLPSPEDLSKMKLVNQALAATRLATQAVDLDNQWHRLLLSRCANSLLLDFIDKLIERTRRYELLLFGEEEQRGAAARQHAAIMDAIEDKDLDRACATLAGNLTRGDQPLRRVLRATSSQLA